MAAQLENIQNQFNALWELLLEAKKPKREDVIVQTVTSAETTGTKELSVSAGMGIPLVNKWGNRSVLNISVQWARQSATNLITENTFRINLGITFNEKWFAKWKVE